MNKNGVDKILGRIPSGIFILTTGTGDKATGMLASWIQQAGFEPLMVTVAVAKKRYLCDWLTQGQPFVINLLSESHKGHVAHFGRGFEPDEPAFEGVDHSLCPRGVPILTESLGHLECEAKQHVDSGDHRVFLANVVRGRLQDADGDPMVHIRNSGAHY